MKKILAILVLSVAIGCGDRRQDVSCEYHGGIIIGTGGTLYYPVYDIKIDGEIITSVHGFEIDLGYSVGDTINRPCIGGKAKSVTNSGEKVF